MSSVMALELIPVTAMVATTTGSTKVLELLQNQFLGWLDVSANDGATTVDVNIEHSADNQNFVTAASFTQVVNTTSRQAKSIDKLLPYVRAKATLAGTPSATVKVFLYYDKAR